MNDATLSTCGTYRYDLTREWAAGPLALWVMLNPSTADAETDDPTIRRCRSFSEATGHGALAVVNLFAFRATDPRALAHADDPVGPQNAATIKRWLTDPRTSTVIAAWGASITKASRPGPDVIDMAREVRHDVLCLGTTKNGHPRHPLYVRGDQPLIEIPARRRMSEP